MLISRRLDAPGTGTFNGAYSWYETCIFRPEPARHSLDTEKLKNDDLDSFKKYYHLYRTTPDMIPVLEQYRVGWSLVQRDGGDVVWHVQSNKVGEKEYGKYTIEWREGEPADVEGAKENGRGDGRGFVEALCPGDRVGLLMRAQYPEWENTLRHASVELMYEVR